MSENRIQIRHGTSAPSTSDDLMQYELGFSTSDKRLYINDATNSFVDLTGTDEPVEITSDFSIEPSNAQMTNPSIYDAYYCRGYVTIRLHAAPSSAMAPGAGSAAMMTGWISCPTKYQPIMETNGVGYNREHVIMGMIKPADSSIGKVPITMRNCSSSDVSAAANCIVSFTYPCRG